MELLNSGSTSIYTIKYLWKTAMSSRVGVVPDKSWIPRSNQKILGPLDFQYHGTWSHGDVNMAAPPVDTNGDVT